MTGVFDAMLETLAEMVERDATADMINSTLVRANHCAVDKKKGLGKPRRLADRVVAAPPNCTPDATPGEDRQFCPNVGTDPRYPRLRPAIPHDR